MVSKKTDAERMHELFAGNEDRHGTHGEPKLDPIGGVKWEIKDTARTLRGEATTEMWQKHLDGSRPLGVVAIRRDNTCVWGSGDIDDYDVNPMDVIKIINDAKLPLVPCRSKSGGLHCFLFASEPVEAAVMRAALQDMMSSIGYASCEIFPKQTKLLSEKGEIGSWIVMPYCGTTYGDKLRHQAGLKRTGAEMTLREFLDAAERSRVKVQDVHISRSRGLNGSGGGRATGRGNGGAPLSDGPPCLQHLINRSDGVPQGGQNNFLFHMGIYLKRKYPEDWTTRLEEMNQKYCHPTYPSDKLSSTIKSLEKKDFQYTCKNQPMASHCDAIKCRSRKFGVGAGETYPQITSISKLNTEPPLWFVEVEGKKMAMGTQDLQQYQRFHSICMETLHKSFSMITQGAWWGILNDAMDASREQIEMETEEDIQAGSTFLELLESWLTNRQAGREREDILQGRPWESEEEQRHYFQMRDLQKFLGREGMKGLAAHKGLVKQELLKLDGKQKTMNIKTARGVENRFVWWVPSSRIRKTLALPAPEEKENDL